MSKADYWKHYMGFDVPCGGLSVSPKPVRLMDWEKFIPVAYEMLRLNNELLRKRLKLDESILLYDYVLDYMIKMAEQYPEYRFEKHKGYGTKVHYEALRQYGPSPIHRRTFLKNL